MPVKDTAREAAFAAMRAARTDVVRVCREIHDDPEPAGAEDRAIGRLSGLLEQHDFEVATGIAGLATAFRATRQNHDADAMRKGLRHGHVALLVHADADPALGHVHGTPTGLAAALGAAIGLGAALADEFGTLTIVGYPGDAALVTMARDGLFDEFDVVFGAQPASSGEGFCHTIDGTGETLASHWAIVTVGGTHPVATTGELLGAIRELGSTLESPNRIDVAQVDDAVELSISGRTSAEVGDIVASIREIAERFEDASISVGDPVEDMIVNRIVARRVKTYADTLGYGMDKITKMDPAPSSGWGNVSQAAPAFLLNFPISGELVTRGETAFGVAAASDESYDRALEFGECLCLAGLDLLRDMQIRAIADDQLVKALGRRGITRQHRRWLGVHPVIREPKANGKNGKNGKKGPKLSDFRMVRGPGMRDN